MANYGAWQAAAEGLNSLSKTGMGLMQMEAQRKHQEALEKDSAARLQMAREQADREKIAWQHAEDKRIQEEKVKKAIIPATLYNKGFHQDQRVRQQYIETMKTMGYKVDDVDGEIFAPMEAFEKVGTLMKAGSDYTALQAKNKMDDLKDKSIAITSQINELMASGKDDDKTAEQINKLKQKKLAIVSEIAESMNLRDSILEAKAKKQAEEDVLQPGRIAVEKEKQAGKPKNIRSVDRGDVVDIYEDGVKVRTEKKGVSPGTAPKPEKPSPANERLEGKEKTEIEAKLLQEPGDPAAPAWAARYNELSTTHEYVFKPTGKTGWFDKKEDWVKQPKGGTTPPPAVPVMRAKNKKGMEITSTDGGKTWKDSKGKVVK